MSGEIRGGHGRGKGGVMFEQFLQYIQNTGGSPKVEQFDEDWEPIGLRVRKDMAKAGLVFEQNG